MSKARISKLNDRGLVKISGTDCAEFLQNLVSCDISKVEINSPQYGALLSPQGKLLFDFIIIQSDDCFLFDIHRSIIPDFIKKFAIYKLRANVEIEDMSDSYTMVAVWNISKIPSWSNLTYIDPRLKLLGYRVIVKNQELPKFLSTSEAESASLADYNLHRINLGIPFGVDDFEYGQVFPHDVNMDYLNGIDFSKGCFVGQEVVSRMKYRGTARRRCIIANSSTEPLKPKTEITAEGKNIGVIGSAINNTGIALVRLDRGKEASDQKIKFLVNESEVTFSQPIWTDFSWPQ